MITTIRKSSIAAFVSIAAGVISSPAFADQRAEYPFMDEVRSCIEETYKRIDTERATHARHVVTDFDTSLLGYTLRIESSITTPENETTYSIYCVANGNNSPIKFRIKELSS